MESNNTIKKEVDLFMQIVPIGNNMYLYPQLNKYLIISGEQDVICTQIDPILNYKKVETFWGYGHIFIRLDQQVYVFDCFKLTLVFKYENDNFSGYVCNFFALDNNVYISTRDGNLFKYDPVLKEFQKVQIDESVAEILSNGRCFQTGTAAHYLNFSKTQYYSIQIRNDTVNFIPVHGCAVHTSQPCISLDGQGYFDFANNEYVSMEQCNIVVNKYSIGKCGVQICNAQLKELSLRTQQAIKQKWSDYMIAHQQSKWFDHSLYFKVNGIIDLIIQSSQKRSQYMEATHFQLSKISRIVQFQHHFDMLINKLFDSWK